MFSWDMRKWHFSCQNRQMKTILVLALDGVMDSSLTITLDTLRAAQAFAERPSSGSPQIRIVTAGCRKTVITRGGLRLTADTTFKQALDAKTKPDWVIVPGLGLITESEFAGRFDQKDALQAIGLLQALDQRGVKTGASCTSVFLLAQAGLLHGRTATMTWWLAHVFRKRYPDVQLDEARMLVRDGRMLTAGSAYAQLDLVLAVVSEAMGEAIAHLCSHYLLIDERPSQVRYMIPTHIKKSDPTVLAAERWIDEHMASPISVSSLSAMLAVSPKTLARRIEEATGVSPVKFIQRRRLMRAAHLIATTQLSVEAIAAKVGYQDGTSLRKLVKREFGTTPGALR
jgi:transcriptional regulator GlxA family with amidase domain